MIRQPTSSHDALAWHRSAVAGENPPRSDGLPECGGWYKRRIIKGGPFVPVRIWLHQVVDRFGRLEEPEVIRAVQLGEEIDAARIWTHLRAISRDEYDDLMRLHRDMPVMAATKEAIDLSKNPIGPRRSLL